MSRGRPLQGYQRPIRMVVGAGIGLVPLLALVLTPATVGVAVVVASLALLAVLHGLGRAVAWLARDDDPPLALVLGWGVAAYLAVGGALLAAASLGPAARGVGHGIAIAVGALWLARRAGAPATSRDPAGPSQARTMASALGALTAAVASALLLLAVAGRSTAAVDLATDDAGELRRLDDTSDLADAIGFSRATGLGGHLVLMAAAGGVGDLRTAAVVDGGILLLLVIAWLVTFLPRPGYPAAVVSVVAVAVLVPGLRWSVVGLMLAAASTLGRAHDRRSPPLALLGLAVAAAVATITHSGLLFAIAVMPAVVRIERGAGSSVHRSWLVATAVVVAMIAPYAVSMARAWGALGAVPVEVTVALATAPSRLVPWLLIAALAAGGALIATAQPTASSAVARSTLLAMAAAIGAAGATAPGAAIGWQLAATIATATVALIASIVVGRYRGVDATAEPPWLAALLVVTLVVSAGLALARFPAGRARPALPDRVADALADARAVLHQPRPGVGHGARDHAAVQAAIPAGTRLGLLVDRPDLVDHARHTVIDLAAVRRALCPRTRAADPPPDRAACPALAAVLDRLAIDVVLVSERAAAAGDDGDGCSACVALGDRWDSGVAAAGSSLRTVRRRAAAQ